MLPRSIASRFLGLSREIYTFPNPAAPKAKAQGPAKAAKGRSTAPDQPKPRMQGTRTAPAEDVCGIAFGSMGHLSALRSDGTLLVFLLRPDASSPEDPDLPMTPMCIATLPPASQLATGAEASWMHLPRHILRGPQVRLAAQGCGRACRCGCREGGASGRRHHRCVYDRAAAQAVQSLPG